MTAGRQNISEKKDWGTPLKYINAVKRVFGGTIDLDPCSNQYSKVNALTEFILPISDGLKEEWNYRQIYVNPPYGTDKSRGTNIKHWISKCAYSNTVYQSEVLALIPVAVNTDHWKKYVFLKAKAVCFLYDTRLKFLENGLDIGKGAPMACAMVYWGNEYNNFLNVFIEFGAVLNLSQLHKKKIGEAHQKKILQLEIQNVV